MKVGGVYGWHPVPSGRGLMYPTYESFESARLGRKPCFQARRGNERFALLAVDSDNEIAPTYQLIDPEGHIVFMTLNTVLTLVPLNKKNT